MRDFWKIRANTMLDTTQKIILIVMISITIIMVCALYKATIELIDNEQMDCNSIPKNK